MKDLFPSQRTWQAALVAALAALCAWAYWPTLRLMAEKWADDPQYSHGYFVPAFALVLLWLRSSQRAAVTFGVYWGGAVLLAAALALRAASVYLYFDWLDAVSFLTALAGLFALLGGRPALRWGWPSLAFLLFMLPLPFRVETAMAHSLQRVATAASTYALQTLGFPAFAEGNVIVLSGTRVGVAEACSGLSMLLVFFALATAAAIIVRRPLPDRLALVASAAPIAVVANVVRITVTGIMYETVGGEAAQFFYHDLAGWLMMPFALVILWAEVHLLSRLLVEPLPTAPVPVALVPRPTAKAPPAVLGPVNFRSLQDFGS